MLYGDPDLKVFLESESFNIEVRIQVHYCQWSILNADENYYRNDKNVLNLTLQK